MNEDWDNEGQRAFPRGVPDRKPFIGSDKVGDQALRDQARLAHTVMRYDEWMADRTAQAFRTPYAAWLATRYPGEAPRPFLGPDTRAAGSLDLTKLTRHEVNVNYATMSSHIDGGWVRFSDVEKLIKGEL